MSSVTDTDNVELDVFATTGPADPAYLQTIIGRPITWITPESASACAATTRPDICFVTGWAFDACNRFADEARSRGAKVVSMIDNRYRGDLRQRLGAAYFRLCLRQKCDLAWVPGQSAHHLCRSYGMPDSYIATGLYGSDGGLFYPGGKNSSDRPLRIGFVGQMIKRKGADLLIAAFQAAMARRPGYELHMFGEGELAPLCRSVPRVIHHRFASPELIAEAMRAFRIFVMPSRDDNWPLALHEASLSGCALLTTRAVGNAVELVSDVNGLVVPAGSKGALQEALIAMCDWSNDRLDAASRESRRRAENFGPARWRREFMAICDKLRHT